MVGAERDKVTIDRRLASRPCYRSTCTLALIYHSTPFTRPCTLGSSGGQLSNNLYTSLASCTPGLKSPVQTVDVDYNVIGLASCINTHLTGMKLSVSNSSTALATLLIPSLGPPLSIYSINFSFAIVVLHRDDHLFTNSDLVQPLTKKYLRLLILFCVSDINIFFPPYNT